MERYVFNTDKEIFEETFGVSPTSSSILEPTFNAVPGHSLPIIRSRKKNSILESAIWGLDTGNTSISSLDLNDVLENDDYRSYLKTNTCIIPANGFYKWKKTVDDPLPFFIRVHTRELLGIAGFFIEHDDSRNSFCVITKQANVLIKPVDDTMPCILDPQKFELWLNGDAETILKKGFNDFALLPEMTVFRVPDLVNDLSNNSPELMQPIPKLRDDE
ncbi:MAG: SOS response-associated peptidase family protein [Balneolaceae bacterium]|nr:SOS response-associated peptidase family protein [Balneolaceae bacterium]MBO6545338.1 SOS response-associated peptidase family protein [Balneolaceae bacterium]MBO6646734.1 SOS response-associated peptidase family protein [Balneolaceae bacterium]